MNIAIFFGGKSFEHDVSIVTAKQIYSIAKVEHNVSLVYLDRNDNFYLYTNANFEFEDFKNMTSKHFKRIDIVSGGYALKTIFKTIKKIDCAVCAAHGGSGENGELSALLMLNKIPVTAGSPLALGLSMDKYKTKQLLKSFGVSVVDGFLCVKNMNIDEVDKQITASFGYPVIIKPNGGGSSIGIGVAKTKEELQEKLAVGFEFDNELLIENALIDFDEYNQAVLGEENCGECSRIEKVIKSDEILSFKDKYLSGNKIKGLKGQTKKRECDLPKKYVSKINDISKKVFDSFGFFGVIRIDYMFDKAKKKLYVNEINAVPGSLAYYLFDNISPLEFVNKLIEIAIKEYKKEENFNKNLVTNLF